MSLLSFLATGGTIDLLPLGGMLTTLTVALVAWRKFRPEVESLTVKTTRELVEGVRLEMAELRSELGAARERVAVLEALHEQDTRRIAEMDRELQQLRTAGRGPAGPPGEMGYRGDRGPRGPAGAAG